MIGQQLRECSGLSIGPNKAIQSVKKIDELLTRDNNSAVLNSCRNTASVAYFASSLSASKHFMSFINLCRKSVMITAPTIS